MQQRLKRLGKSMLSIIMSLSIIATCLSLTALPSNEVQAGTITNIITGKWAAIGLEYLERGAMRTLGSAAAHADNDAVSDILSTTKRFLSNPQSNTLADIKKLCVQMNNKLDALSNTINKNNSYISGKLQNISKQIDQNSYNSCVTSVKNIDSNYSWVLTKFDDFFECVDKADINDDESIQNLQLAYNDLISLYEAGNGIHIHTEKSFNFTDDAFTLAGLLSPYNAYYKVDPEKDVADKSGWGSLTGGDVLIEYYYNILTKTDAFDHEFVRDMSAEYNYLAGIVANYMEAYLMYISYYSQYVYSQTSSNPAVQRNKQREIDGLWKQYDQSCYIVLRALSQMVSLHDDRLRGAMRDYDVDTTIYFSGAKNNISAYYYLDLAPGHDEIYTSDKNKTDSDFLAAQVRPYNSNSAYSFRKVTSDQQTINMEDLCYTAFKFDTFILSVPMEYTGFSCDYYNLAKIGSSSPSGWKIIANASDINELVNPDAFDDGSVSSNLKTYLSLHGVNDLPAIDGTNKYATTSTYEWNPGPTSVSSHDINMTFVDIGSGIYKPNTPSTATFDMDDDLKSIKGKETAIIFKEQPNVAFYLPTNSGASYQYSGLDFNGKEMSVAGGRNVLKCGTSVTLRIKPDDNKYIKSLKLVDKRVWDTNPSDSALYTYISEDNELYSADCGIYPESDGYYTFVINVPFRDAKVELELGDSNVKSGIVTLAESETIDKFSGADYYDHDGGILLFDNFTSEKQRVFDVGDTVNVAVIPYTGYTCKGIEVTDSSGNKYEASQVKSEDFLSLNYAQRNFSFTMPDADVTVTAVYDEAFRVTLMSSDQNATVHFVDENGTVDSTSDERSYDPGSTVKVEVKVANGYVIKRVTLRDYTNRKYLGCVQDDNSFSFIMPEGDVTVEAVSEIMDMSKYIASFDDSLSGYVGFVDSSSDPYNVSSIQVTPGDKVYFTSQLNKFAVKDSTGADVEITNLNDNTYSFIMPSDNVEISASVYTARINDSSRQYMSFTDKDNNSLASSSAYVPDGTEVTFIVKNADLCHCEINITDSKDNAVDYTWISDNIYSFVMPESDVSLSAVPTDKPTHDYENGICRTCGEYEPAYLNSDGNYEIGNAGNFLWYAALVNGEREHAEFKTRDACADAVLVDNIDLENRMFTNIGKFKSGAIAATEDRYIGSFDGQGHTIKNFYADGSYNHWGMFGMSYCDLKNLTVKGTIDVTEDDITDDTLLGIVAYAGLGSKISDVTSCLEIRNNNNVCAIGGIVGLAMGSLTIQRCIFLGSIDCTNGNQYNIGGIIGDTGAGNVIKDCANIGNIKTKVGKAAGIVGIIEMGAGSVSDCYNYADIESENETGPIAASASAQTTFDNCYHLKETNETDSPSEGMNSAVSARFSSGEIGYKLNHSTTDGTQVWYQNIDNGETPDAYPLPDKTKGTIYYIESENRYSNYPDGNSPVQETVTVSIDTDKFIVDENGNPTSYLTFDSTGTSDPCSVEKDQDVVIRYVVDEYHKLDTVLAEDQTSGEKETLSFKDGSITYHVTDRDIMIIPSFIEKSQPEPQIESGISTYEDLCKLAQDLQDNYDGNKNVNVWLENNIVVPKDSRWTLPIGTNDKPFCGIFDGKGYAIMGLNVSVQDNGGLFGVIGEGGLVKNLSVIDCDFNQKSDKAGGIAAVNNGTIDHCISGINVENGLVINTAKYGKININTLNSYVTGTQAGGVAAENNGTIIGTRNGAYVTGTNCGGLVCTNNGTIYGCANNGPVGSDSVSIKLCGGLTCINAGTIGSSYNSGKVNGSENAVLGYVAAQNDSAEIDKVFYNDVNGVSPIGTGVTAVKGSLILKKNLEMLDPSFTDELNNATDSRVRWKLIATAHTQLNMGYPVIECNYLSNRRINAIDGILIDGMMHNALNVVYHPIKSEEPLYSALQSAAAGKTLASAYSVTIDDGKGNYVPPELWCGGVTLSVPVDSNNVSIVIIDSRGNAQTIQPESINDGFASFTVAEPVSFAVAKSSTFTGANTDNSLNGTPLTGDSAPLIITMFAALISAFAVVIFRKRKAHR